MPSKYWIKLYHEMLHDPKMGRLSDHLYRRCIEMFLLAGEYGADGLLPSPTDMAWTLRADDTELQADLLALAETGILTKTDKGWLVTKFAARQEAVSGNQRVQRYRERNRKAEYLCNAPVTKRYTDTDRDEDADRDEIESVRAAGAAPDSVPSGAPDSVSVSVSDTDGESPELEDAIRHWSDVLHDSAAVESNLTQMFAIWGGYPQIRAPDLIRLVNETGAMVRRQRNVQRPMAYFFRSIRGQLERQLGPPKATKGAARVPGFKNCSEYLPTREGVEA